MRTYNNDIFSYTTRVVNDFQTVGVLGAVTGANAGNCPQGRILTETGRKLYPGANPGITHLMVGVFDYATGLSGFIDPNSAAFTPQNTDRPYYFTSPGANTVDPDPDRAPPVFTRGDVLAQGNFDLSGSAHIYGDALVGGDMDLSGAAHIYGAVKMDAGATVKGEVSVRDISAGDNSGNVVADRQVRSSTLTTFNSVSGAIQIDSRKGQVHRIEANGNLNITTVGTTQANVGSLLYIIINNNTGGNISVDFDGSFKSQNAGVYTLNANTFNTFSFVCDGSFYYMLAPAALNVSV
jgi:hypothetical protein